MAEQLRRWAIIALGLALCATLTVAVPPSEPAAAQSDLDTTMLLFDLSGSMELPTSEGQTRLAVAQEQLLAHTFADEWWAVLGGGSLDGPAWLERIGLMVEPAMVRDPSRTVLETAIDALTGTTAREVWRQAVSELRELLERPTMDQWSSARYPSPDYDVGRWDGPVFHPPLRIVELEVLRSALPLSVEFDAAIEQDALLALAGNWPAVRAHALTTGERLRRLALRGLRAEFPGAEADVADVVAAARSLSLDDPQVGEG